jgi:hypothetical protein
LVSFRARRVSNDRESVFRACRRPLFDVFWSELFWLKLSVSGITNWVDGDEADLYIRSPLPDAGREAA